MITFAAGLALGRALAWLVWAVLGRRGGRPAVRGRERRAELPAAGLTAELLPEPALGWLLRSHGALGLWITELDPSEEGPRAERTVGEELAVAEIAAVDRRLERARDEEQSGSDRVADHTLVFRARAGVAVGMLLPGEPAAGTVAAAGCDLDRLLEAVRQRPRVVALAQAESREASLESVGSVGLRLAYQLERNLGGEVVVAVREPAGVRVVGISGRGDRRLLDAVLPAEAPLARVAAGEVAQTLVAGDPLGGVVADRRQRQGATLLVPIPAAGAAVGAVAVHLPTGQEPAGPARAELVEALANAGPRLARALEAERTRGAARVDPLTSLQNRRGLDEEMRAGRPGALIAADLDHLAQVNDALGHPAGDAALVHFSRLIREQVRAGDVAARIGGEEFAVWLPEASLELGLRIAERIRVKLGTTPWDWRGRPWPLTASFGVAASPETTRDPADLVAAAEGALALAKRRGRNRVEAAGPGQGENL